MHSRMPAYGVAALTIAAAACSDITEPAPAITTVTVATPGPLMRTLTVELDRPGAVTVIYGDGSGSELEIERSEPLREHSILMSRLAPSSQYSFQVLSDADQYAGDFTTAGLPTDLAAIDFTATSTPTHLLTLVELHPFPLDDPDSFRGVVFIDGAGTVVWYFRGAVFGVTRRPSGNFVFMDLELGLLEVTPAGSVVSLLVQEPAGRTMHHDVTVLSDGTVLFLANDRQLVDDVTVAGEGVWAWNPERLERRRSCGPPLTICRRSTTVVPATASAIGCTPTPSPWGRETTCSSACKPSTRSSPSVRTTDLWSGG